MRHRSRSLELIASAAVLVSGCGGGTDGTGAVPPATAVTSSGAMVKGSVILNGTRFESAGAAVSDDRGRSVAQLATGMVVRLRGRSDDLVSGVADRIDIENEARGAIASVDAAANPRRFEIGGLTVLADAETTYANLNAFAELAVGLRVEVHGLRDADGQLRATRIEKVGAAAVDGLDELRGTVGAVDPAGDRFTLNGALTVDYSRATFRPTGVGAVALLVGRLVEVRGSLSGNVFAASEVDIEDLEDGDLNGAAGEKQEIEGFISGYAGSAMFQVNGRSVQTTRGTKFSAGSAADLDDNVLVEVEGVLDQQGVLVAEHIKFGRTRVILQGAVSALDPGTRTLVLLGQTALADDLTRIDARPAGGGQPTNLLTDIALGDCAEVRGHLDGSTYLADWIRERSNCNAGDVAQARVTGVDDVAFSLTLLGNLIASLPASAQYTGADGATLSRTQFFAAITARSANNPGTLVKVRGDFGPAGLVADAAELQND